jgi:hypothetical protein
MEESERLRAELGRLYALATWTRGKQAEAALMRLIEEADERLRKIWNPANDREVSVSVARARHRRAR